MPFLLLVAGYITLLSVDKVFFVSDLHEHGDGKIDKIKMNIAKASHELRRSLAELK